MLRSLIIIIYIFACSLSTHAQDDSLNYRLFRKNLVLYADIGYKAAPFDIKYDAFPKDVKTIKFRHNIKPALGIGIAYKWFAFRIGFGLPMEMKPVSRFGHVSFTDVGLKFNIKRTFWDIDFRSYSGYVIQNAYKWNDTLNSLKPNDIRPNTQTASFSINCWYFRSPHLNMHSVFGIRGDFKESTGTWYYKSTLNYFGVGNSGSIIPIDLQDSTQMKTRAHAVAALDIGLVPGYAYIKRQNFWQFSVFGGLGAVIQTKTFQSDTTRSNIGLAPRIDLRFIGGYSKPKYFFWLVTDFDIKSISFIDLAYRQNFYTIKLVGGYRFRERKKKKKT